MSPAINISEKEGRRAHENRVVQIALTLICFSILATAAASPLTNGFL
jgi:hypothetical protein